MRTKTLSIRNERAVRARSMLCFIIASTLSSITAFADYEGPKTEALHPVLVDVMPTNVFTPLGFDDNDPNAQVIIEAALPDTCYKRGRTKVDIDIEKQTIRIRPQAYYYGGAWCAPVQLTYSEAIDLGMLREGQYKVFVEKQDGKQTPLTILPVAHTTSASPDDYLYAPVKSVHIDRTRGPLNDTSKPQNSLVLTGTFGTSCMKFKEVKINVRENHVIEVLPIAEVIGTDCVNVTDHFSISSSLKDVASGHYLVHVRSPDGQSINQVVDL